MSIRTEKVSSELRQALARPLADIASEISAGFITVTHVRMSPDLRIARVYLSVFGGKISPEQTVAKVSERAGSLRKHVNTKVRLRFSPELHFYLDDTLDAISHIETLLKNVPPPAKETDEETGNKDANSNEDSEA
ncbi:MAG: 30S ribosome-binding factor RbfA [Ignavibacteria bacterium]|nr:30S ribosome-binding factor RbfA [Ignavibacteria bacterium]MBL7993118.1 30S ribosome-binding factor RbfA [Candidatus Kapabacteria bacterium]